ncbi:MAG: hypothetical protein HBSAPP03_27320 [Phycisphaerae bacterium]|nr:MAG: hypothetical protein HBSAPP03_27320 [Phycisphaerae bacterium]
MKAWVLIAGLAGLPIGATGPAIAQGTTQPAPTVAEAARTLADATNAETVRRAAAQFLVSRAESSEAREAIERELSLPLSGTGGGGLLLDTIRASSDPSNRLFPILTQRLDKAAESEIPRIIGAISPFRTRDAARLLVTYLDPGLPDAVRQAAGEALSRLSGQTDRGTDVVAWSRWLHEAERMTESQWRLSLAQSWARRAQGLEEERARLARSLVASLRELHLATAPAKRSSFLASLVASETPEVRDLGLELVGREVAASATLGPEVGLAVLSLLASDNPDVRATAAGLVRPLAPPGAGDAVARALEAEQNAAVAGALLVAAGRWPGPAVAREAMRWMERRGAAHDRAAETLWLLYRAGELPDAMQNRVLELIRVLPESGLTAPICGLIGALGEADDRARLIPLLEHDSTALRYAAAEALTWSPEHAEAVLTAASRHAELFEIAARVVLIHRPTADGLGALLAMPRPDPDVAREAILRVAAGMSAADLWDAVARNLDPGLKRPLLQSLCAPERVLSEWDNELHRAAILRGVLALAEVQTAAGMPENALALLHGIPAVSEDQPAWALIRDSEAAALIVLGRLDEARALNQGAPTWLRALSMCLDRPHATEVVGIIDAAFGTTLTPEQKAVVAEVRAALPKPRPGVPPEAPK